MSVSIFYSHEFKRNVRKLLKKYPPLPEDLDDFVHRLQIGNIEGDLLQHVGCEVYKARIKNSDNKKGKSGGYRIIYYCKQKDFFGDDLCQVGTGRRECTKNTLY